MARDSAPARLRANAIVTAGVILTLLLALMMASADGLERRFAPEPEAAVVLLPTDVAVATIVPVPTSPPTPTPTTTPSPTAVSASKPDATAVPIVPTCGEVPDTWVEYTVRLGDTLHQLSLTSGATVDEIIQANCLEINQLVSGMTLRLPESPPERVACGPPPAWILYTVQAGQTLFSLARIHGTTVFAAMQANCLTSSRVVAGRQIYLPLLSVTATPMPTETPTSTPPPPTQTPEPIAPSATPLPSATSTSPAPATSTPTATAIPADSPTPSATPLTPPTATLTSAPTATSTSTATMTPTSTPSPTSSPTTMPSPTDTATAAPINTDTPEPTPTETAVP